MANSGGGLGGVGGLGNDHRTFDALMQEFRRVGVDPDTFSAMLALRPEDALRALQSLPDNAGAAAFLSQLRRQGLDPAASPPDADSALERKRRDRSA